HLLRQVLLLTGAFVFCVGVFSGTAWLMVKILIRYFALALWLTVSAAEAPGYETGGVGVVLGVEGRYIVVKSILPDTPASAQKDIHVGDKILAVAQDKALPVQV